MRSSSSGAHSSATTGGGGGADPSTREFVLRGQILAVRGDDEVLVKHDEIKGFMPAMTMPYKVRQPALLRRSTAGDLIVATVAVSDTDAVLTRIERTGTAPIANAEPSAGTHVALLRAGDLAPDGRLTDEAGQPLSLAAWRGAAVAITFIYTRCPLPQFCPLMERRFGEVQAAVKRDSTLLGRARLLSVSFDPDRDTAAVLAAHAARLHADPKVWSFATAARGEVDAFAAAFGVNVIREADTSITHNLRTAVLDQDGRLLSVYDGSEWTATQVVEDLRRALTPR